MVVGPRSNGGIFRDLAPRCGCLPVRDGQEVECPVNADNIQKLDRVIHEKARMGIMALLAASATLTFTEIREALKMTDGNLSVQIRTLQEAGYVAVTKSYRQRRPCTTCALTPDGRRAFREYIATLAKIIEHSQAH